MGREYNLSMQIRIYAQLHISPRPIAVSTWVAPKGMLREGSGGGPLHKRTTPKIFGQAKELHHNVSAAEANLRKHLRAHEIGDVHFPNHTAPAVGAGGMR